MEPRFNEVLGITNAFLQPRGQNYSKMYGTEPQFNEILVITNTIHKRQLKIYLDVTNCQYVIKDECQTDHRQPKRTMFGFGLQRSFGQNILELLVYYLMPNKCKNVKDMKSSCLSICTSSL